MPAGKLEELAPLERARFDELEARRALWDALRAVLEPLRAVLGDTQREGEPDATRRAR